MTNIIRSRLKLSLLSVLMAVILLFGSGCSYLYGLLGIQQELAIPFSEMVYTRPDLSVLRGQVDEIKAMVADGSSLSKIEKKIQTVFDTYSSFITMMQIASIKYSINTTDSFYIDENAFFAEAGATSSSYMEELYKELAKSKFCEDLEKDIFGEGFLTGYLDNTVYTDEVLLNLFQQEASAFEEYRVLMSEPSILWEGQETPVDLIDTTDMTDEQYLNMIRTYADKYNQKGAEIYIRLIKIRNEIAKRLGYDTYEQYCYDSFF